MPHEINTSLRLILAGPTPLRGGATQKCGGEAPAIIFVCPSPTRVGAAEDEVMGGDDLLGLRNAPTSRTLFLVGTYTNSFGFLLLFRLETFFLLFRPKHHF